MAVIGSSWAVGSWSDLAWAAGTWADAGAPSVIFSLDMNARLYRYLCDFYNVTSGDVTTMTARYLAQELTGDYTARLQQLIAIATAAAS